MVVKPLRWITPFNGGYLTTRRLRMVKTASEAELEEMLAGGDDMAGVCSAVNAVQDTAWKVQADVLEVARVLWSEGGNAAGLPSAEDLPLPLSLMKSYPVLTSSVNGNARRNSQVAHADTYLYRAHYR